MRITQKDIEAKIALANNLVFGHESSNPPKYGDCEMFVLSQNAYGNAMEVTCKGSNGSWTAVRKITPTGTKSELYWWITMFLNGFSSGKDGKVHTY